MIKCTNVTALQPFHLEPNTAFVQQWSFRLLVNILIGQPVKVYMAQKIQCSFKTWTDFDTYC